MAMQIDPDPGVNDDKPGLGQAQTRHAAIDAVNAATDGIN